MDFFPSETVRYLTPDIRLSNQTPKHHLCGCTALHPCREHRVHSILLCLLQLQDAPSNEGADHVCECAPSSELCAQGRRQHPQPPMSAFASLPRGGTSIPIVVPVVPVLALLVLALLALVLFLALALLARSAVRSSSFWPFSVWVQKSYPSLV